jgi:hypothetical protein
VVPVVIGIAPIDVETVEDDDDDDDDANNNNEDELWI